MIMEMQKLASTARKMWQEGRFNSAEGKKYLESKAKLLGLDGEAVGKIEIMIANLDGGIEVLNSLSTGIELSDFVLDELKEYCEIKQCESDYDIIISAFRNRLVQADTNNLSVTLATVGDNANASEINENDRASEVTGEQSRNVEPKDMYWLDYRYYAQESLEKFSKALERLGSAEELVQFNLPKQVSSILEHFEKMIATKLIEEEITINPNGLFDQFRIPLLDYVGHLHGAFTKTLREKRWAVNEFRSELGGGGSRYVGYGSLGMAATAGAMNMVGGLFSGARNWSKANNFANELDAQVLTEARPMLMELPTHCAEVLGRYYDILCLAGYNDFEYMGTRYANFDYVLNNLEHLPSATSVFDALTRIAEEFPFPDDRWLAALVQVSPHDSTRALSLAKTYKTQYQFEPADIQMAVVLIAAASGNVNVIRQQAKSLSEVSRFTFNPIQDSWPLNATELTETAKLRLAALLLADELEQYVQPYAVELNRITTLLNQTDASSDPIRLLTDAFTALRNEEWTKASTSLGTLVTLTPQRSTKVFLCGLFTKHAIYRNGASVTSECWTKATKEVGCNEEILFDRWSGTGRELLLLASCAHFAHKQLDEAKAFGELFGSQPLPHCTIESLPWTFNGLFTSFDEVGLSQAVYIAFLRNDFFTCSALSDEIIRVVHSCLKTGCPTTEWLKSLIALGQGLRDSDPDKIEEASRVLTSHAKGKSLGILSALRANFLARSSANQIEVSNALRTMLESGTILADVSALVDCSQIEEEFSILRTAAQRTAMEFCSTTISASFRAIEGLFTFDGPNPPPFWLNEATEVCKQAGLEVPNIEVNPEHLIGYWIDSKALILVLSYGLIGINRKSQTCHTWLAFDINSTFGSGWINDYLKVDGRSDNIEIPVDLQSGEKDNFQLFQDQINTVANLWREALHATQLKRGTFSSAEWLSFCQKSAYLKHPLVSFKLADQRIFDAVQLMRKAPIKTEAESLSVGEKAALAPEQIVSQSDDIGNRLQHVYSFLTAEARKFNGIDSGTFLTSDDMNEKKMNNFLKELSKRGIAGVPAFEEGIALYDNTLFGKSDVGVLLTRHSVYWIPCLGDVEKNAGMVAWGNLLSCELRIEKTLRKLHLKFREGGETNLTLTQVRTASENLAQTISAVIEYLGGN